MIGGVLETLRPEQRAVLGLVLTRRRSYDELAAALQLDRETVRARARAALETLAAPRDELPLERRADITDYLLGQQGIAQRARTREFLSGSAPSRVWALSVAQALAPLAAEPLPEIPPQRPREPRVRPARIAAAVAAAATIAAIVVLAVGVGGSGSDVALVAQPISLRAMGTSLAAPALGRIAAPVVRRPAAPTPRRPARGGAPAGPQFQPITLLPTNAAPSSAVAAATVAPEGSARVLVVQAEGVQANLDNGYAVWLSGSRSKRSHFLGFVNPGVGASGAFTSGTDLPRNVASFRELLITLETSTAPRSPGLVIFRGSMPKLR